MGSKNFTVQVSSLENENIVSSGMMLNFTRAFSSTAAACRDYAHVVRRRVKQVELPKVGDPITKQVVWRAKAMEAPPYPFGDAVVYKQSNRGLYGGKTIQRGHQISEFGNRNLRTYHPNVHWHKLWSEALGKPIRIRTATSVLRSITREGGLDNYLIKDKAARIKELGPAGWKLRFKVLTKLEAQAVAAPKFIEEIEGQKVYAIYQNNKITRGRTGLLRTLFGHLRMLGENQDEVAKRDSITFKHFMSRHKKLTIEQVLEKLEKSGYDLSKVAFSNVNSQV